MENNLTSAESALPASETLSPEPEAENSNAPLWVLTDGTPGHKGQALGVAERLGIAFRHIGLHFSDFSRLPNLLLGASLKSLSEESKKLIRAPWPRIVIAAGRKTAPIARYIKKQSGGNTKIVQIMWPGAGADEFDLIVLPEHDDVQSGKNILVTTGTPHCLSLEEAEKQTPHWRERFTHLPHPWIALLVGGDSRYGRFTERAGELLGREASRFALSAGGSLLVTTSRRTRPLVESAFVNALSAPGWFHDWRNSDENPYLSYLALADAFIVTGDSASMISEACFTGKPVFIFDRGPNIGDKHRRFHQQLYAKGMALPLYEGYREFSYEPLDAASLIAGTIRERFHLE